MVLTGKTLEHYEIWFDKYYNDYWTYYQSKPTISNALIIDFFFSKYLHITEVLDGELNLKYILTPISENCFLQEQIISENTFSLDISLCKIEAIKKANEIYNTTL